VTDSVYIGADTVRTRIAPMRLTDQVVKRLPSPPRGNKVHYDDVVKGFGCRVTSAGAKSFILNYRRKSDGLERRTTLGSYPDWGTASAREEAKRLKRKIDAGGDPVGQHQESRAAATMADLCVRFEREYLPRKRASTARSYRQQIAVDIIPPLGRMKVAAVSYDDVDALHRKISARAPIHANRVMALLSRIFSLAIRWKMRADNPVRGIERNSENKRQRYLTGSELERLSMALTELKDQGAANAVRLLLLTGCRRGELLAAKWADIKWEDGAWLKPGATTKQRTDHRVPLSAAAIELLTEMRARAGESEYLFPAKFTPHRLDIDDAWNALRKAADLPGVRAHDLRHTYASVLASRGLSLPIIGSLLGHTTAQTTLRYSHLMDDPLRAATEKASDVIARKST
jgi:integrase